MGRFGDNDYLLDSEVHLRWGKTHQHIGLLQPFTPRNGRQRIDIRQQGSHSRRARRTKGTVQRDHILAADGTRQIRTKVATELPLRTTLLRAPRPQNLTLQHINRQEHRRTDAQGRRALQECAASRRHTLV